MTWTPDSQRPAAQGIKRLVKNARCPVVATCTVSRDADGARCGVLATKLGCPRYFQLPFCSDESLESLLAARAPGDSWKEVRAHVAALADGDARKALVLLDAALLDDGPASEDEVASTTPEAIEPWCPRTTSNLLHQHHLTSNRPKRRPRAHTRGRCTLGARRLTEGVAFDQITHVGGRLPAFVDIPKARPAQRFEAIVVVRSDGARSDASPSARSRLRGRGPETRRTGAARPAPAPRRRVGRRGRSCPRAPRLRSNVAGCRRENAPSPGKQSRRRVVVDDDEMRRTPRPTRPTRCPWPDAPAAAPVPATPPVVTQAAPMETEPAAAQAAPMETEPRPRRRRGRRRAAAAAAQPAPRRGGRGARRARPSSTPRLETPTSTRRRRLRRPAGARRRAALAGRPAPRPPTAPRRWARPARRGADAGSRARAPPRRAIRGALRRRLDRRRGSASSRPSTTPWPCGPSSAARRRARRPSLAAATPLPADAAHSASALAFAYAAGDLSCPPSSYQQNADIPIPEGISHPVNRHGFKFWLAFGVLELVTRDERP